MVKGVSRQVVVVRSPDQKLYEQAIFILREDAHGYTEDMLLKEALEAAKHQKPRRNPIIPALCAVGGAALTGLAWLLTLWL